MTEDSVYCVVCGEPATTEPNVEGHSFCGEDCQDAYYEESEYDGQPDEMQEWHDFDPDC